MLSNNNKTNSRNGIKMDNTDCDACFKAFNVLYEELSSSELIATEEFQYWVFERGYNAALKTIANVQKVDAQFLDVAWSSQPSLEQDFALH